MLAIRLLVDGQNLQDEMKKVGLNNDGTLSFAWTQKDNQEFVRIWNCSELTSITCDTFKHSIVSIIIYSEMPYHDILQADADRASKATRDIIFFPRSAAYVHWSNDHHVSIIREPNDAHSIKGIKVKDLLAVLVTPEEDALIFVQKSQVTAAKISLRQRSIGRLATLYTFDRKSTFDTTENTCSVTVVQSGRNGISVYVGNKKGKVVEISCTA